MTHDTERPDMLDDDLVTGLAHIGIRVYDLERSRAFYELLGFRFVVGPVGPEPVATLSHPSGIEINLILNAASADDENILMDISRKHAGYTHVALSVRDLDAAIQRMAAAGHAVTEGPNVFPSGGSHAFVRDPDRNVVELNQPAPK